MTVMPSNHLTVSLAGSMYHTFEWGGVGGGPALYGLPKGIVLAFLV